MATLAALAAGRWRHDMVAVAALLAAVAVGLVPGEAAFAGLGNAAVVTVAAILVIGRTISATGVLDAVARRISDRLDSPVALTAALCGAGAVISTLMNNVGALALLMPVALAVAARHGMAPSRLLMPLSFATLLGGMVTLVGTPPNLLMAQFRQEALGEALGIFSLAPVGLPVAACGVAWLTFAGPRLTPERRTAEDKDGGAVIGRYQSELHVRPGGGLEGRGADDLERALGLRAHGILRGGRRLFAPRSAWRLEAGDVVLAEADATTLDGLVARGACSFAALADSRSHDVLEVVVPQQSVVLGSSARSLYLGERFGITLVAAARHGRRFEGRLEEEPLAAGDVLLLAGEPADLHRAADDLGLLRLFERAPVVRPRRAWIAVAAFAGGLAAAALGVLPAPVALVATVLALVLSGTLGPADLYRRIDWSVVVLLAALIPLGDAFARTGAAGLLAGAALEALGSAGPHALLAATLAAAVVVTQVLNNVATVVVMAPLAIGVARQAGLSMDPFLFAVAIGASCAFLTPFGHHNNTIVMAPGGYRFGDYWKLGLPLTVIVMAVAVAVIPLVRPFGG
ncbi:SLC13 family permease [Novispirillum sp. DQ9]|uniref:SLC13 family permease n=1 Tax=Novispirillum sp. DQ9 TaxID=3398612 RepID=UPI003C7B3F62